MNFAHICPRIPHSHFHEDLENKYQVHLALRYNGLLEFLGQTQEVDFTVLGHVLI